VSEILAQVAEVWEEGARKFWPEMIHRGAATIPAGIAVDSNQRATVERLIDRAMAENPMLEMWEAAESISQDALPETAKEAARRIASLRTGPTFVYLAFHGVDGIAQYVKVGISRHPEQRLYGMATGNPLDCLWAFTCRVGTAEAAYGVEQRIIRHLDAHKRRGEWLEVGQSDKDAAFALARQLTQFAKDICPSAEDFVPLEYRDGR